MSRLSLSSRVGHVGGGGIVSTSRSLFLGCGTCLAGIAAWRLSAWSSRNSVLLEEIAVLLSTSENIRLQAMSGTATLLGGSPGDVAGKDVDRGNGRGDRRESPDVSSGVPDLATSPTLVRLHNAFPGVSKAREEGKL